MGGGLTLLILSFSLVFFSCSNSSGDGDSDTYNGNTFNDFLKYATAEKEMKGDDAPTFDESETEGIRINFTVPTGSDFYNVLIDGIGQVYEKFGINSEKSFFYPYVNKGKNYKVLIFFGKEDKDSDDNTIGNVAYGWKILNVTAKGGKGEVLMTKKPGISVNADGKYTLTAPEFSNANLIPNWYILVQPYNGRSWENKAGQARKWMGNGEVKNTELNTTHNIYDSVESYRNSLPINFIACCPSVKYNDDWTYRWDHAIKEPLSLLPKYDTDDFREMVLGMPASKKIKDTSAFRIDNSEQNGIRINFTAPKGIGNYQVAIDGMGTVYYSEEKDETAFFYPYVEAGKKYNILVFYDNGHSGWIVLSATANGGLGEVTLLTKAEIEIENNKQDIKFTKKPTFENESKISGWKMKVDFFGGDSWATQNWIGQAFIENNELLTSSISVYGCIAEWATDTPIGFLDCKVLFSYTDSNDVEWEYRWPCLTEWNVNLPPKNSLQ